MTFTQMYELPLDIAVTKISNSNILLMLLGFKLSGKPNWKKLKVLIEIYATLIAQENKS